MCHFDHETVPTADVANLSQPHASFRQPLPINESWHVNRTSPVVLKVRTSGTCTAWEPVRDATDSALPLHLLNQKKLRDGAQQPNFNNFSGLLHAQV